MTRPFARPFSWLAVILAAAVLAVAGGCSGNGDEQSARMAQPEGGAAEGSGPTEGSGTGEGSGAAEGRVPPRPPSGGFATGAGLPGQDPAALARDLDGMAGAGATWVRVDFDWPSLEPARGTFRWDDTDRVVDAARARGLRVLALPAYTPSWARPPGTPDKHPPTDPEDYARFVAAAVERYAPLGVKAWEVWNEPNIASFWRPAPDPAAYTRLLVAASRAIRSVDSEATVLTAGTSPASNDRNSVAPVTFLAAVYRHGGGDAFDAVGHHPYHYPHPVTARGDWNAFWAATPGMRKVMVDNGDGDKQIWATEYGAPTGTSSQAVSEDQQAALLREGMQRWARWDYTGPLFIYAWRDAGTDAGDREHNFGVVRRDGTPKPALAAVTEVFRTGG